MIWNTLTCLALTEQHGGQGSSGCVPLAPVTAESTDSYILLYLMFLNHLKIQTTLNVCSSPVSKLKNVLHFCPRAPVFLLWE